MYLPALSRSFCVPEADTEYTQKISGEKRKSKRRLCFRPFFPYASRIPFSLFCPYFTRQIPLKTSGYGLRLQETACPSRSQNKYDKKLTIKTGESS